MQIASKSQGGKRDVFKFLEVFNLATKTRDCVLLGNLVSKKINPQNDQWKIFKLIFLVFNPYHYLLYHSVFNNTNIVYRMKKRTALRKFSLRTCTF